MAKSVQIASVFTAIGFKVNKKDLDRLQKQLGSLKKQIRSIQSVAKLKIDPNTKGLSTAKKELVSINRELNKLKAKTIRVKVDRGNVGRKGAGGRGAAKGVGGGAFAGSFLGSEAGQFAPGVGALGLLGFSAASILKTGQQLQAVRAGLIAAAGGVAEGKAEFQFMIDLSNKLGINFQDNVRSYQNFLASSNSVDFGLQRARKSFAATASMARVLGLSAADTNGVMRAMTQLLSKGSVQSEELRGQLGERLPGAVGIMAKALGVSVTELNKMLEQGEVISKEALPKMADALIENATAHGALQKAVNTNLANQERMANAWFFFIANIANSGFMDVMTEAFVRFITILDGNTESASTLGVVFTLLARVFKAVLGVVGDLISGFSRLPAIFQALFAIMVLLLLPFSGIIISVITLIGLLEDMFAFLRGEDSVLGIFIEQLSTLQKVLSGIAASLISIGAFKGFQKLRKAAGGGRGGTSATPKSAGGLFEAPSKASQVKARLRSTLNKTGSGASGAGGLFSRIFTPIAVAMSTFEIFTAAKPKVEEFLNLFTRAGQLQNLRNQLSAVNALEKESKEGFLSFLPSFPAAGQSFGEQRERLQERIDIHVTADQGFTPVLAGE